MTYEDFETEFRAEQISLSGDLKLNLSGIDFKRLEKDWKGVRSAIRVHQVGGFLGLIYLCISVGLGVFTWPDMYLSLPLFAGAAALLLNAVLCPVKTLPMDRLERFSGQELAEKLIDWQRYARRRFPMDCFAVFIFLFGLGNWYFDKAYDLNFFRTPLEMTSQWLLLGAVLAWTLVMAHLGNAKNLRDLQRIEAELKGWSDNDYV